VTLLAVANGAQDLASTLVAALSGETSDVSRNPIYLAIGALVGAAVFITMIITSTITLKTPASKPILVYLRPPSGRCPSTCSSRTSYFCSSSSSFCLDTVSMAKSTSGCRRSSSSSIYCTSSLYSGSYLVVSVLFSPKAKRENMSSLIEASEPKQITTTAGAEATKGSTLGINQGDAEYEARSTPRLPRQEGDKDKDKEKEKVEQAKPTGFCEALHYTCLKYAYS
jgi:hypothetical protein